MCYGFMNYYPVEAGTERCVSWEEYDQCAIEDYENSQTRSTVYSTLILLASLFVYYI